ncbi:MAG TPA: SDR family oxidoreductase [Gemmatimonadaceae bacterium]|nr:SDR family oxidoreductase [Gemmatimonadaceae bacterium]
MVTGVAHRGQVGEAVAEAFARQGDLVCVVARSADDANARSADLAARGHRALAFACDLADPAATSALAHAVASATGRIDALVNLAGGFAMSGPVADSDPATAAHLHRINVDTALLATRAFLPALRQSQGAVVYVASAAALPGARVRNVSAYAMAKTSVLVLMRAVAQEERAHGVRANAIAPAAIRTAANAESMPDDTRYVEREDVAAAVVWLCSPEAAAVTGQVVELSP